MLKKSIIKKYGNVKGKLALGTVDLSKKNHVGYFRLRDDNMEIHEGKRFTFTNNKEGFDKFYNKMLSFKNRYRIEKVVVGIESTGSYGEPFLHYLDNLNILVVQVNPMHTKRVKELEGNSPNKTDNKDPKVIADIIELGHSLSILIPKGIAAELRRLINARERILARRTRLKNQLESLLAMIFPEYTTIMKGVGSKSSLYILKHLSSPAKIIDYRISKLSKILKKISRGKLGKSKAEMLYKAALDTVGIKEGIYGVSLEIELIVDSFVLINESLKKIEDTIKEKIKKIPYSKYIMSIKGVGEITAAAIIGEIGDFTQFKKSDELIKFAGLNLYEISSGTKKGQHRISKRGRALLRKYLYFLALNTVKKNGIMHNKYQKDTKAGKRKIKVLIAIGKKLLRIIFALVRDEKEYIENFSQFELKIAA